MDFFEELRQELEKNNLENVVKILDQNSDFFNDPSCFLEWEEILNNIFKKSETRKQVLKIFLEAGLNIEFRSLIGRNLFHLFCDHVNEDHQDAVEIADMLVKSGVSMNRMDRDGYIPLHSAIYAENIPLVAFMLEKGANLNHKCHLPLNMATRYGNMEIIDMLLSFGADINAKCSFDHRFTALHLACLAGDEQIVNFLIRKGADISLKDLNRITPYALALDSKNDLCIKSMIKVLAKRYFQSLPVNESDLVLIKKNPATQDMFNKCLAELLEMQFQVFYKPFSYFHVLKFSSNLKKMENLVKNDDFVKEFQKNLSFLYYGEDLIHIFEKSIQARDEAAVVSLRLKEMFGFIFPCIILRKIGARFTIKDLPQQ